MVFIIGASIALFLCLLLLLKKQKTTADTILLFWLAAIAIQQLLTYLDISGKSYQFPHLLGLSFAFPLLQGAFLYLYASSLTNRRHFSWKAVLPHLLPFVLLVLLAMPFYTMSGAEKIAVFKNQGKGFEWFDTVKRIAMLVCGVGYVLATLYLIRKNRKSIENVFSNTEHKNLRWLEYLSIGLGGLWFLVAFFDDGIIFSGVILFVLFIGFYGIHQLPIFHSLELGQFAAETVPPIDGNGPEEGLEFPPAEPARYAKSGLKTEDAETLYRQLTFQMQERTPYKNPKLTLVDLAKTLHVHPNYLSQVINDREQKNFYHYINTLRVEEFMRLALLPQYKHFTLLSLAYDCGFNSKSTFNKYFKQCTGTTPSDYFKLPNI